MMRTFVFICILSAGCLGLSGQSAEDEVIRLKQSQEVGDVRMDPEGGEPAGLNKESKSGYWNTSVGTSISYMKGYGSGMQFYAAPAYTLPLANRWSLHGGLVASHFTGFGTPATGESQTPGTFSSLAVFGAASYRMNERLIFHGSGVKQLLAAPASPLAPYPMDHISLGATYKLGNNISIGASMSLNQGRGYSPFYSAPINGSQFYGSPFMSPFGW